jgi:pimeloyl-ACP methyl ester carboxylesterase
MNAPTSRPFKSTNVRPVGLTLFAAAVRGVAAVRPTLAAQMMLKAFCTPRRPAPAHWPKGLEPEQEELVVEGEKIAVYRWGPALNGKKVLLAHGWSGRSQQLRSLIEPLRSRGFAVYAFDQTAHGASSGKTTNLPRFARTLSAVCTHLGHVNAVVAHSLGAPAAAHAIRQGLPIERLVMVAPPAHPRRFITVFWRSLGIADSVGERMNRRIEETEGVRLRDLDLAQLAQHLTLPTLVVHDRTDREVPFIEGEEWSWALPDAQLLTTEGLGHNRLLAAPLVTETIARFLDGERVVPMPVARGAEVASDHPERSAVGA